MQRSLVPYPRLVAHRARRAPVARLPLEPCQPPCNPHAHRVPCSRRGLALIIESDSTRRLAARTSPTSSPRSGERPVAWNPWRLHTLDRLAHARTPALPRRYCVQEVSVPVATFASSHHPAPPCAAHAHPHAPCHTHRPATSTCSTPTSRRPTTTSPVRRPPLQPSNPPSSLTPTHRRLTHPAADDRSKNLRPKRNIRTAMNHEIMLQVAADRTRRQSPRTHATTRSRNSLSPTDTVLRKRSNWASTFAPAH